MQIDPGFKTVSQHTEENFPTVPPPPSEVSIRTMESDIRAMMTAGGSAPEYQRVPMKPIVHGQAERKPLLPITGKTVGLVAYIAGGAAVFVGSLAAFYFFFPALSGYLNAWQGGGAPTPAPSTMPPPVGPPAPPPFTHRSFLIVQGGGSAEARIAVPTSPEGGKPLGELLASTLGSGASTGYVEIILRTDANRALSFEEFLRAIGAPIFDTAFLRDNFSPDMTMFGFRDGAGYKAGYVLKLKEGKDTAYVSIAQLETSKDLEKLFIAPPGERAGTFEDAVIGDRTYRRLLFTEPGTAFYYGWHENFLVMATSEIAFKFALTAL